MRFTIPAILCLALAGAACGSDDSPSNPTSPSSPATPSSGLVTVEIRNSSYQPNPVTVKVGSQVNWHNSDNIDHTATSDTGMFDNFVNAMSAHGAPVTMSTAGTFAYHCTIHSNMRATIVVQP
jgi:plastocyanin